MQLTATAFKKKKQVTHFTIEFEDSDKEGKHDDGGDDEDIEDSDEDKG